MATTDTEARATGARPEDEKLPPGKLFIYGLQHILTMYGGLIAPPLIVGQAAGLSGNEIGILVTAGIFVSGLATMLQTLGIPFFGSRLPLVQGVSFASVATMATIASQGGGIPAVYGSIIVAGLIGLAISPVFSRIARFFPPVVSGSIITVIGLSLLPTAFDWAMGGDSEAPGYGSMANIGLAGATLLIILLISRLLQGLLSRLSILLGIVLGTALAAGIGMADFSDVTSGAIFAAPQPLHFGAPHFDIASIVAMTIVILVILTETTADIFAIGEIAKTNVSARRLGDGLRADMLSTVVAPFLNSFPASAFAQNVGLVALTRVTSRFAVATGGGILVVLGLLPVVGRVVAAIPSPVLGGAGLVLFGTVAASGIRTLSTVDYDGNLNLVLVAVAVGFGILPIASPDFWTSFPDWVQTIMESGISAAAIMAVLLNLLFNELPTLRREKPSVVSASPPKAVAGSSRRQ